MHMKGVHGVQNQLQSPVLCPVFNNCVRIRIRLIEFAKKVTVPKSRPPIIFPNISRSIERLFSSSLDSGDTATRFSNKYQCRA